MASAHTQTHTHARSKPRPWLQLMACVCALHVWDCCDGRPRPSWMRVARHRAAGRDVNGRAAQLANVSPTLVAERYDYACAHAVFFPQLPLRLRENGHKLRSAFRGVVSERAAAVQILGIYLTFLDRGVTMNGG